MKILFMGTPAFAVPSLERLAGAEKEIAAVVTQPDRPRGRSRLSAPPAVKTAAKKLGIGVYQPEKVSDPDFLREVDSLSPALIVVVAFGQFLPRKLWEAPPRGTINLHPSLLPRWRGAAPIRRAVIAGDEVTGVTTMFISRRMDAGDIIFQEETPIGPEESYGDLRARLASLGADLLLRTVDAVEGGKAPRRPQDESLVTLAPKVEREEARIDWTRPAGEIHNLVRGMCPAPGAFAAVERKGKRMEVKILRSSLLPGFEGRPGEVISAEREVVAVGTGSGALGIVEIQPAGKRRMGAGEFLRGYRLEVGSRLG